MGYVSDTDFVQFISPFEIQKSAGTWTKTLASNTVADVRTAADATFNLFVPVVVPSNNVALKGAKLLSVELLYKVATAACDAVGTVELEKMIIAADGSVTGAAATVTIDTGHDTDAERLAVDDHRMVVTLDTPAWVDADDVYWLYVAVDAAATTVFTLWGAKANYQLRA